MDFHYWDTHKIAAVLAMFLIIASFAFSSIITNFESLAWERAAQGLTERDVEGVFKYLEAYQRQLSSSYYTLDSFATWMGFIGVLAAILSGITALSIPKRYQKQGEEPKQEKPEKERTGFTK